MTGQIPYDQAVGRFREEQDAFLRDNPGAGRIAWLRSLRFAEMLPYAYDVSVDQAIADVTVIQRGDD